MTHQSPATDGVLVGIPAYEEAATVGDVVRAAAPHAAEVLVVDDGSDDETAARAAAAGATVRTHETNRGYGAALQTLFEAAAARETAHLVVLDADGQHDANDVPALVAAQRETRANVVTGSRRSESSVPLYRRVGLAVVDGVVNTALRVGYGRSSVSDTQCGFRAYDRRAVETLANASLGAGMGASLDILFLAAERGLTVAEVPTEIDYDVANANTHNPVVHGLALLSAVAARTIRDRPGRVASAGTAFAGSVGLPAATVYLGHASNPLAATLLVAVGVVVGVGLSLRAPGVLDRLGR